MSYVNYQHLYTMYCRDSEHLILYLNLRPEAFIAQVNVLKIELKIFYLIQ